MVCSVIIIIITALFSRTIFATNEENNASRLENFEIIENTNPLNIKNILLDNTTNEIVQEMVVEEIDLEYKKEQ